MQITYTREQWNTIEKLITLLYRLDINHHVQHVHRYSRLAGDKVVITYIP